jgi:hypothetical protein
VKLKSGSREIFKYLKKLFFYIIDPLKKVNELVKKTVEKVNQYRSSPTILLRQTIVGFPCNIGAAFFASERIWFVLLVFSKKIFIVIDS